MCAQVCSPTHAVHICLFRKLLSVPLETQDYMLALGPSDCIAYKAVHINQQICYIHLRFDLSHILSVKETSLSLPLHWTWITSCTTWTITLVWDRL